jgi:acetyl-CoA acetyltransferase
LEKTSTSLLQSVLLSVRFCLSATNKKGAFGGKLKDLSATELGGIASRAAIASVGKPIQIDSVIYGNVLQTSTGAYFALFNHSNVQYLAVYVM